MEFAVNRHIPIPEDSALVDPFSPYADLPMSLYSRRLMPDLELVKPEWFICQFARYDIPEGNYKHHSVIIALVKVRTRYVSDTIAITMH